MSLALKAARARSGQLPMHMRGQMGDPGLFGFLGGLAKKAVGSIPFVGGVAEAAIDAFSGGGRPSAPPIPRPRAGPGIHPQVSFPAPGGRRLQVRPTATAPGGTRAFEVSRTQAQANGAATMKLACPGGFHPNKSSYFLVDGTFIEEGTKCVKNRRRNPLNPRALRRSVARIEAGKRWQGKLREIETERFTKAGNRKEG